MQAHVTEPKLQNEPHGGPSTPFSSGQPVTTVSLSVRNFRSLGAVTIDLRPGLNVLIGPNGSGKSNVVHAFTLLRDILREGVGLAIAASGGVDRTFRRRATGMTFELQCPLGVRKDRDGSVRVNLVWTLGIRQSKVNKLAQIAEESVAVTTEYGRQLLRVSVTRDRRGRTRTSGHLVRNPSLQTFIAPYNLVHVSRGSILKQIRHCLESARERAVKFPELSLLPSIAQADLGIAAVHSLIMGVCDYNILPDHARASAPRVPSPALGPAGEGLSEVIDALEKQELHRLTRGHWFEPFYRRRNIYLNRLAHSPGRPFSSRDENLSGALEAINLGLRLGVPTLSSVETTLDETTGRRLLRFVSASGEMFYPPEVSDGTVKWLALLTALYVPQASIFLLEEPENFLHPWMQHALLKYIREQSAGSGIPFLLTTHSISLVASCTPDEVLTVDLTSRGTRIRRLSKQRDLRKLMSSSAMSLGDLWLEGTLGGVPHG